MKIVIDARFWAESGIGRYIRNLINNLEQLDKENTYVILLLKKDYGKVEFTGNFTKVVADFRWYGIGEQVKMLLLLRKLRPDLVHFPHFNVPFFYQGKFVITIHDLIHQHHQNKKATTRDLLTYTFKKFSYGRVFNHAVKKSAKIITPSSFVKEQLINEYKLSQEKIIVTQEAVEESIVNFSKEISLKKISDVKRKFHIYKPYLFYIGNAHPHKNVLRLINVFKKIKEEFPEYLLVLSGPNNYFWQKIRKDIKLTGVVFTGFVSDEEMVALYKNAEAFIMPSMEEGFGIPILEAMACKCPVISSKSASLPEVGGDAAIYFDPQNEEDMVVKISRVLKDEKLRKELIKKGEKRYQQFSWEKMAKQTLEVYNDLI
ncbi:MAG: glycosyltransferase family 4 protein [Patescibacteria group bacterium]|nr:glycosyltransferase family 4 protein [Patescibacteria group bacterium]